MKDGALAGVTVIDLTRVLAGPYCSMMLADMGANVIKVEMPGRGDDSRAHYPQVNGESAYFMNLNRNKRSMTLDLKKEEGKEILRQLVKKADIILENYRPGVMDRLGLGYEDLKKVNPAIIYGCVSGFGHYGPYSQRPGYDIIGQAMGGLMSTTGWPGGEPTRSGTALSDVMGGFGLTIGVLSAYINKQRTGIGQMVDVSLVDSVVSSLEIINMIYLVTGRIPERIGNRYEAAYPYDTFKVKDGSIVIACGNDKLFKLLTDRMGQPELQEDPRFCTNVKRVEHHAELKPIMEDWLKDYDMETATEMILGCGCPAGPIYNIKQVTEDPHIAGAREMFVELEHPVAGKMKITGNQIKLSETPVEFRRPAPLLGEHTDEILEEFLGYAPERCRHFRESGVV